MGTFGFYMANKYPSAQVIIFEPDPRSIFELQKNLLLNPLSNVELVPFGLWSENQVLEMTGTGKLSSKIIDNDNADTVSINVVSLDDYFPEVKGKLIFLKMNIEGAEVKAIEGAQKFLSDNFVDIAISTDHYFNGRPTKEQVEYLLSSRGMVVESVESGGYVNTYASNITVLR